MSARNRPALAACATAALLVVIARWPSSPEVRLDTRFDEGRNAHSWSLTREGTCGPGTTTPPSAPSAPDSLFQGAPLRLRAVSGRSGTPDADECAVFLKTVLHAGEAHSSILRTPTRDWRADLRFRLGTRDSVLTVLVAFGRERWRYVALMIPDAGAAAVPYTAPGRIDIMKPAVDFQGDNPAIEPGADAHLEISYSRASNAVRVHLDGRPVAFAELLQGGPEPVLVKEWWHEVDDFHRPRSVKPGAVLLSLYTEARVDGGLDSVVELNSARFVSHARPALVEAVRHLEYLAIRPYYLLDFRGREHVGRLYRRVARWMDRRRKARAARHVLE